MSRSRRTTTKNDLARQVAEVCGFSIKTAEMAIDAMVSGITRSVRAGNRIEIRNFGVFLQKHQRPAIRGDVRTGARVMIPGCLSIGFKAADRQKVATE